MVKVNNGHFIPCKNVFLREILTERKEVNKGNYEVYSVSVTKGIVNQIEYLGRSFAAKDTSDYNVVHYGDLVYTKSPTGNFPYGIIKVSNIYQKVAVSPLYGVYKPSSHEIGLYLHYYFCNALNANNYLHKLIEKGAKNTINISNKRFLENKILIPQSHNDICKLIDLITSIAARIKIEKRSLKLLNEQKKHLLQNMFI